jgi:hypothetical protein
MVSLEQPNSRDTMTYRQRGVSRNRGSMLPISPISLPVLFLKDEVHGSRDSWLLEKTDKKITELPRTSAQSFPYPTREDIRVLQELMSLCSAGSLASHTALTRISCLDFREQEQMITSFQEIHDSHLLKVGSALQPEKADTAVQQHQAVAQGQQVGRWPFPHI